jgi:hypothetical protein
MLGRELGLSGSGFGPLLYLDQDTVCLWADVNVWVVQGLLLSQGHC